MLFPVAGFELHPLVPTAIGFGVGIFAGMFGVGGGFLTTPILMWLGVPPVRAVGSGLNQIVAASASGTILKSRLGNVSLRLGLLVAAGGVPASVVGTLVVNALVRKGALDVPLKATYAALLMVVGLRMALDLRRRACATAGSPDRADRDSGSRSRGRPERVPGSPARLDEPAVAHSHDEGRNVRRDLGAVALGVLAGVLSAFIGVGGGVILVPAMIYLLRVPTRIAVGTSLLQILCISFAATVSHAALNVDVDVVLAALLMAGSVPGSWLGVWLCRKLGTRSLRGLFGAVVLAAAARMVYGLLAGRGTPSGFELPDRAGLGPFLARIQDAAVAHPVLYGLTAACFALAAGSLLALAVRRLVFGRAAPLTCDDDGADGTTSEPG